MLWPFTAARRFPVNYALISTVTAEVCLRMAGVIASNVFFYTIGLNAELRDGAGAGGGGGLPLSRRAFRLCFMRGSGF